MNFAIEVLVLPVSDVDRARAFYTEQAGFTLDVDYAPTPDFRVVQLTPPGSGCSIQVGVGLTDAVPGSGRGIHDPERAGLGIIDVDLDVDHDPQVR